MLFSANFILAAAAALLGLVEAGKKGPRAPKASVKARSTNSSAAVSLKIKTDTGIKNATAPYLYGWMFEDINHSGDGGLYGELLRNRAFEGSDIRWGIIPDIPSNSIVWQENACEALGTISCCF